MAEAEPKPKYEPPAIEKYMAYFVVAPTKVPAMVWALIKQARDNVTKDSLAQNQTPKQDIAPRL